MQEYIRLLYNEWCLTIVLFLLSSFLDEYHNDVLHIYKDLCQSQIYSIYITYNV